MRYTFTDLARSRSFAVLLCLAALVVTSTAEASTAAGLGQAVIGLQTIANGVTGVLTGPVGRSIVGVALLFCIYKMIFGEHGVRTFMPWAIGVALLAGSPYLVGALMPGSGLAI